MSILADFFLAETDAEAAEYDGGRYDEARRERLKKITILEMSTLWAALDDVIWEVDHLDDFDEIRMEGGGLRMTNRIPAELVELLATSTQHTIISALVEWAGTDEMSCTPSELEPVIRGLVRLARCARHQREGMYLWNCV